MAYYTCYDRGVFQELLSEPDRIMARAAPEHVFKSDATTTVARISDDGLDLVIKRYNTRSRWHIVKRALRKTRAMRSWDMAHELLRIGVATPRPAAVIEERLGPFRRRSYYVNEFVAGQPCGDMLGSPRAEHDPLRDELVRLFARLSQQRISHGDMKATNILVHDGRLVLVDLDAARQHACGWTLAPALRRDRRRLLRNWGDNPALSKGLKAVLNQTKRFRKS